MSERANISRSYVLRLSVISLFCIGFALYCLYDGIVAWPKKQQRALAFKELKDRLTESGENNKLTEQWARMAEEKGWSAKFPEEPKTEGEYEYDIWSQYVMAGIAAPPGLLVLIFILSQLGRWIEPTENGLRTSKGNQFTFDQIVALDKKKWKNKGIAKVRYQENGRTQTVVLDDCKYERGPTEKMLRLVESNIHPEKIIGGLPESDPIDETQGTEESVSPDADDTPHGAGS